MRCCIRNWAAESTRADRRRYPTSTRSIAACRRWRRPIPGGGDQFIYGNSAADAEHMFAQPCPARARPYLGLEPDSCGPRSIIRCRPLPDQVKIQLY
jgi:hypothetical protein